MSWVALAVAKTRASKVISPSRPGVGALVATTASTTRTTTKTTCSTNIQPLRRSGRAMGQRSRSGAQRNLNA